LTPPSIDEIPANPGRRQTVRKLFSESITATSTHALFVLLLAIDIIRTLRHAMWRDELEIFSIALGSSSLADLLVRMRYEAHPALWYLLVWFVTRATSDPMSMQILHIGLAVGVWVIVYLWSPFSRFEKILLLLSYFLFWEYFVISRNYVLIALTAFSFIILREQRPRPDFVLWLMLGLLSNTHLYGAIWSIALAPMFAMESARSRVASLAGPVVYLSLLVFAVATMVPPADFRLFGRAPLPPDFSVWGYNFWFSISRLNTDLSTPVGAFLPFNTAAVGDAIAYLAHPATASFPSFWNLNPTDELVTLLHADTNHPVRLALVYAAPVIACWLIARQRLLVLEFALVYVGIILFENIWSFPGGARHHGVVFLAFVAAVWSFRARRSPSAWAVGLFIVILMANACGGLLSLASELRPFSEGYDAAAWLKQNHLETAFIIASRDGPARSVAGYLGRDIYYLGCECTFPEENANFRASLSPEEFGQRLAKGVAAAGQREVILIRNEPLAAAELKPGAPNLSATLLKSFTDAVTNENFWIYRLNAQQAP
jgi:hypothetical protein